MARHNGRDLRIVNALGQTAGVFTTKTLNINNTAVDVTGDDDQGFITLLERPGTRQITMEGTFIFDDTKMDLFDAAITGAALLAEYSLEFLTNGDVENPVAFYEITGDFYLASVSITGASDGRIEGTASLQSSGPYERTTA